ncbi:AB hydrolase superfamily protein [Lachnellula suecica]|uniref:AB hydrolase superfamily protein n=1 Tax=Lachnellula suecica TaxID=602035 RepID=A0A8T9BZR4_9HELO|nr:AB hydrolase superfamily protein [Lachnellula suecica]
MSQLAFSLFTLASLLCFGQSTPLHSSHVRRGEKWETLPATPALPTPVNTATFAQDGTKLWFQKYNTAATGTPIVLIHGGLGYSAYFGDVITILSKTHPVIAVDRRGHGRSTYNADDVFTFDMFAQDTYALLQAEGVTCAVYVGWSDGAATTLASLLNTTIASTITKAFVFAGFQSFSDTNSTFTDTAIYAEFLSRSATEYATLQPSANFTDFGTKVGTLEATLPDWSDADLAKIDGSKVTIAGADHDEAVNLAVPAHLSSVITGSSLVMLKDVSHFAPVQDATAFAAAVEAIL